MVGRFGKVRTNWSKGSFALMHSPREVASRVEEHLPNLLSDITAIVDGKSQADPQFRTNRLYTRLTATEVRRQLIGTFGYRDDELPTAETIATKLKELGYALKKAARSQPQKNCPKPIPSLRKS